ncbi:hypothetical protein A1O1_00806 [Capronia coronata CBS 617.96]|uniref:F-box domain-containing protein n=1 Tax=Capronia coronata CBS 617.96 TaxID=1182541 RepID=W9YT07_9EURO|nr:uncharacterized protein A1O1_00806 [Capronia coronata CBS 617.96]EXJ95683.1 hypothetical protein A1O1_00806 [Capronia coronata CBS 617.96]
MSSLLTKLPDEVLQVILYYMSPPTNAALQQTCRRFIDVANEPLLWKCYCERYFRWWDKRHQIKAKFQDATFDDWKAVYADRYIAFSTTRNAIKRVISEERGRLDAVKSVLDAGYDAKDTLIDMFWHASSSENHLAQRYWSHAILGCLHRLLAVEEWVRLRAHGEATIPFEGPLAALDMFVLEERPEGDMDDIFSRLDSYVASVRAAHPDIDDMTPREKAITIADHLIENKWVGIQGDRHYHSLDHMFLGVSLFSENRNSVPLVSAVIFCYIARQYGLRASPCSFPFHVHALVEPPEGIDLDGNPLPDGFQSDVGPNAVPSELTHMYMDPFNTSEPIPLSSLQTQLVFIAPTSTPNQTTSYLSGATTRDMTIRTAHNILSSSTHYPGAPAHPINRRLATYAALFSLVILPSPHTAQPANLRQHLAVLTQHFLEFFDLDIHLYETHVLPLTDLLPDGEAYRSLIQQLKEADHESKSPKHRSDPQNSVVKYRVGQIFRHRRRGYLAVIYGWDPYCRMQEQWITMNRVDRLPNGRHQPFYNVLVDDESTRYVAEENVVVLEPDEVTEDVLDAFPVEIGKWFKRFDGETGTFVSNVRDEYPED